MRKMAVALGLWLATSAVAMADPMSWPDLSQVPEGMSGGGKDAAIIVGVENYTYLPDVPGAAQNALDWYRFLSARGVPSHKIRLLVDPIRDSDGRMATDDPQGTNDGILAAVHQAAADVEEGGTLWFIFIGHGAPGLGGDDGMLVGVDASGTARGIYSRSVSRDKVLATLAEGSQAETVAILDTCFSGRSPSGDALVADLQPVIPIGLSVSTAATVLTATSSNQFAGPLPMGGRPAFSYLTLGALHGWGDLNRDGQVTASEAVTYSRNSLLSLITDRVQEPQLEGGNANLVLSEATGVGPDIDEMRLALINNPGGTVVNDPGNPLGSFVIDVDVSSMLAEQQCERSATDQASAMQRDTLATRQEEDSEQILEQWETLSEQATACSQLDDAPTRRRCHEQVTAFGDALEGRQVEVPARVVAVDTTCGQRQSAVEGLSAPSQAAVDVLMQVEGVLSRYNAEDRLGGATSTPTPGTGGGSLPLGRAGQVQESLRAGFSGDPRVIPVRVAGTAEQTIRTTALDLGPNCGGYVASDAPALTLEYRAGRSPLRIAACSAADTTLLVRGPGGSWQCDDDTTGVNPEVRLNTPRTGTYEVFIGNVSPESTTAELKLSELTSRALCEATVAPIPTPAPTTARPNRLQHTQSPRYGTATLRAGFSGDPRWVAAQAGGSGSSAVQVSTLGLGGGCRGVVDATRPDYLIDYDPGQYALRTGFCSDGDTSLVIRSPSGRWSCDDDGGSGNNPEVAFTQPESGLYGVWIGTVDGPLHNGHLWMSERANGDPCRSAPNAPTPVSEPAVSVGGRPNYSGTPRYGSMNLRSGFTNDPATVDVVAGGQSSVRRMNLDPACSGFIAPAQPDYRVNFEAGRYTFRIAACSSADTTLVVSDGRGNWRCADDSEGRNPIVQWNDAPSGAYDVWVGRISPGEADATLVMSEAEGPYCRD